MDFSKKNNSNLYPSPSKRLNFDNITDSPIFKTSSHYHESFLFQEEASYNGSQNEITAPSYIPSFFDKKCSITRKKQAKNLEAQSIEFKKAGKLIIEELKSPNPEFEDAYSKLRESYNKSRLAWNEIDNIESEKTEKMHGGFNQILESIEKTLHSVNKTNEELEKKKKEEDIKKLNETKEEIKDPPLLEKQITVMDIKPANEAKQEKNEPFKNNTFDFDFSVKDPIVKPIIENNGSVRPQINTVKPIVENNPIKPSQDNQFMDQDMGSNMQQNYSMQTQNTYATNSQWKPPTAIPGQQGVFQNSFSIQNAPKENPFQQPVNQFSPNPAYKNAFTSQPLGATQPFQQTTIVSQPTQSFQQITLTNQPVFQTQQSPFSIQKPTNVFQPIALNTRQTTTQPQQTASPFQPIALSAPLQSNTFSMQAMTYPNAPTPTNFPPTTQNIPNPPMNISAPFNYPKLNNPESTVNTSITETQKKMQGYAKDRYEAENCREFLEFRKDVCLALWNISSKASEIKLTSISTTLRNSMANFSNSNFLTKAHIYLCIKLVDLYLEASLHTPKIHGYGEQYIKLLEKVSKFSNSSPLFEIFKLEIFFRAEILIPNPVSPELALHKCLMKDLGEKKMSEIQKIVNTEIIKNIALGKLFASYVIQLQDISNAWYSISSIMSWDSSTADRSYLPILYGCLSAMANDFRSKFSFEYDNIVRAFNNTKWPSIKAKLGHPIFNSIVSQFEKTFLQNRM
ncbi:unnamed protein product [Blepharisma stoltei]|uniref:Nucleoporin GLE1 n=1 Tax=Blepharisma stoltei TaxID=1481888 RepID=A0AAU9JHC4_9CILI|nr:unnamed protein product [Blepharisma stoltei]